MRNCAMRRTKSAVEIAGVQQAAGTSASDRDSRRRCRRCDLLAVLAARRRARGRRAPELCATGAFVRISAPVLARRRRDGLRDRAHAAAHESPQSAIARRRRPCSDAAGCRRCRRERGPPLAPITPSVASVTLIFGDSNHSSRKSAALCVKILTRPDDFARAQLAKPASSFR